MTIGMDEVMTRAGPAVATAIPSGETTRRSAVLESGATAVPLSSVYGDLLPQLGRAVQRATIYPPGHPSVAAAVQPVVETANALLAKVETVSLLVSRQEMAVVATGNVPGAHAMPWLASRLVSRGVASVTIGRPLTLEGGLVLAEWLSRSPGEDERPLDVDGTDVHWRDYARTRFTDQPGTGGPVDALALWQETVNSLVADWLTSGAAEQAGDEAFDGLCDDPRALAHLVRDTLLANEGTGLSVVIDRIVTLGGRLADLDEAGRALVRGRLGRLVGELAPELRSQLLRVVAGDSPEKLHLLSELVDELPQSAVLAVVEQIEIGTDGTCSSLVTLLARLTAASRPHAVLHHALAQAFARNGLPAEVLHRDGEALKQALEQVLVHPVDTSPVGPDYQAELDRLDTPAVGRTHQVLDGRLLSPTHAEEIGGRLPRIALALLVRDDAPRDDSAALLKRALAAAPAALAAADVDFLAALAETTLRTKELATPNCAAAVRLAERFLEQPRVADLLLEVVADASRAMPVGAAAVLAAAGETAAEALCRRLALPASTVVRDRLLQLAVSLDIDRFTAVLVRLRPRTHLPARVAAALLADPRVTDRARLAEVFLDDTDPDIRFAAHTTAFDAISTPARLDRLVRRALEDEDGRIVLLAAEQVQHRHPALAEQVLGRFVSESTHAADPAVQCAVVTLVASGRLPHGASVLAAALAQRGLAWQLRARQVSRHMVSALERVETPTARAAVRRWRWSPAGVLSRLLRDVEASA